jgi:hypothetical protein
MSGLALHFEILPPAQREIWPSLRDLADRGFVLYGGTAIALRLGHRSSIDFDFFTEKPLDRTALSDTFSLLSQPRVIQDQQNTLSLLAPVSANSVKVSFFGGIEFGRAGVPERSADGVAVVASILDLLATKLKVMQQRIEAKDYQDVAAILRDGIQLEEGLAAAAAMFGSSFQPSEALKALGFFEGGDLNTLTKEDKQFLTNAITRVRHIRPCGVVSRTLS